MLQMTKRKPKPTRKILYRLSYATLYAAPCLRCVKAPRLAIAQHESIEMRIQIECRCYSTSWEYVFDDVMRAWSAHVGPSKPLGMDGQTIVVG
jgi:hypothetical protein